jgi:hypothetical protein
MFFMSNGYKISKYESAKKCNSELHISTLGRSEEDKEGRGCSATLKQGGRYNIFSRDTKNFPDIVFFYRASKTFSQIYHNLFTSLFE